MSTIHLNRSKSDRRTALKPIEVLWDAPTKSPEVDELEVLSLLVEAYEKEHIHRSGWTNLNSEISGNSVVLA